MAKQEAVASTEVVTDVSMEKAVRDTNKPTNSGKHVLVSIFPKLDLVIKGGEGEWVRGPGGVNVRRAISNRENVKFYNHTAKVDTKVLEDLRAKREDGLYKHRRYGIEYIGLDDWKALYKNDKTRKQARDFVKSVESRHRHHLAGRVPASAIDSTIEALIDEIFFRREVAS